MEHRISIDESLWEKAKIEAEKREVSTNEIVKQALETFLGIDTKKLSLNSEECWYSIINIIIIVIIISWKV